VSPTIPQLLKWGANYGPLSLGAEPWRMLASNYVHGGIIHIALNMWCLWNLGFLAERIFEPWTYVLTYTFCGTRWQFSEPVVASAGGRCGRFGSNFRTGRSADRRSLSRPFADSKQAMQSTLKSLLVFAGYNLFFGAADPGIDNSAHIGGLLAGLAIGAVLAKHLMAPPEIRNRWRNGVFVAAAVVLVSGVYVGEACEWMAPQ
jgi:rhomboid protease GluP